MAGDFNVNWGTAPYTWTAGATGPVTFTATDQYGFQIQTRIGITRIGGVAVAGYPDDLAGFGTQNSLWLVWNSNAGSSGIGEATNTATLEVLSGGTPLATNGISFRVADIDATDNGATDPTADRCDFVTLTGNAGNPTLTYVGGTPATRSVLIGVATGSGSTGTINANQAQCIYNIGVTGSPISNADDLGTILATYPSGTHTATVAYDESIENVYGSTNRNADSRGIGVFSAGIITVNQTISLDKTANKARYTTLGETITYTFTVTNNGPLPIRTAQNIYVNDDKLGLINCGSPASNVASGGTFVCTQNYTVTAADLLAPAGITNNATAGVGTGAQSFATRLQSNSDSLTVANGVIDAVNDNFSSVPINGTSGGTTATVFGNDTLSAAAFAPAAVNVSLTNTGGLTGATINSDGTISVPPGSTSGTYTLTYQICDAAFPAVCDTATAVVTVAVSPPSGGTSCTGTNLAVNGGVESPAFPAPAGSNMVAPGSVPGWSTNDTAIEIWESGFNGVPAHTGNQFMEMNANLGTSVLVQTPSAIHARAQIDTFWAHRGRQGNDTARMTIADNGGGSTTSPNFTSGNTAWTNQSLIHVATAAASSITLTFDSISSTGGASLGNFIDTVEVCQTYVTLDKTEGVRTDVDSSGSDTVGDTISYQFAIANPAGNNRSLASVSITDDKIGVISVGTPLSGDINTNGFLDPGETWITTANYTLTQADIDAGSVTNNAQASASTGTNTLQSDPDAVTATLTRAPALTLTKVATFNLGAGLQTANGTTDNVPAGTVITYTYEVANTGNVTISGVTVSDVHNGSDPDPVPGNETPVSVANGSSDGGVNGSWDTLRPGDTIRFTANYTVTPTDVDQLQ